MSSEGFSVLLSDTDEGSVYLYKEDVGRDDVSIASQFSMSSQEFSDLLSDSDSHIDEETVFSTPRTPCKRKRWSELFDSPMLMNNSMYLDNDDVGGDDVSILETRCKKKKVEEEPVLFDKDLQGCDVCYEEERIWFKPKTILTVKRYKQVTADNESVENPSDLTCKYCGNMIIEPNQVMNYCHCHEPDCEQCMPRNFCTSCKRCFIPKEDRKEKKEHFYVMRF